MSAQHYAGLTNLGFTLNWMADLPPYVLATKTEIIQQITTELTNKASVFSADAQLLHTGLLLPYFWAIVKTSEILKQDGYRWWRLDQCVKHMLASWILSHDHPRLVLAQNPLLWEIYPTMIVGTTIEARVNMTEPTLLRLDCTAPPQRFNLSSWIVSGEEGSCMLLADSDQFLVNFTIAELRDGVAIRLLV